MVKRQLNRIWLSEVATIGKQVDAIYHSQDVLAYQNNPLIEALPPILEKEAVARALTVNLDHCYDEQIRSHPPQTRIHSLHDVSTFFVPLPNHITLEQSISIMVRQGLQQRNPMQIDHWQKADQTANKLRKTQAFSNEQLQQLYDIPNDYDVIDGIKNMNRRQITTLLGQALIGHSGLGKSTTLELILRTYPQLINHSNYQGKEFHFKQIVWVYLQCPHDGSIKSLCLQFFDYIDKVLGTNYYSIYANNGRKSAEQMVPNIAHVIAMHGIGLIVIDELQNLNAATSGGPQKMMNFFMNLINIGKVPVFLVGTPEALPIVTGAFRLARRTMPTLWQRMDQGEIWDYFLDSFWHYQYTQHEFPLTRELSKQLYFETQGILDLSIKLFVMAQVRAISNGDEVVTPETLHKVAQEVFYSLQPMLDDYRQGKRDSTYASQYLNVDIQSFVEGEVQKTASQLLAELRQEQKISQKTAQNQDPSGENTDSPVSIKRSQKPPSRRASKRKPVILSGGFLDIFQQADDNHQSKYEALKQAGYIESLEAFLS